MEESLRQKCYAFYIFLLWQFILCFFLFFPTYFFHSQISYSRFCYYIWFSRFSEKISKKIYLYVLHSLGVKPVTISVQFSRSIMSDSLQPHGLQHTSPLCPSPTPLACSNSCPLGWWCHPTISSSVIPFSSCPQSLPASGSFPMSQFFTSGGQSIEALASASVL